jgi:hypothetical protein
MTASFRSVFRTALAALLAFAQPAVVVLGQCLPASPEAMAGCEHSAPARDTGPDHSAPSQGCAACCCLPSGVLASTPLDTEALLAPISAESIPDQRIRERMRVSLPRLLPFAIAPPAVA